MHAATDEPMNVTFMRVSPDETITVDVPLLFIGEDACPGLKKGVRLAALLLRFILSILPFEKLLVMSTAILVCQRNWFPEERSNKDLIVSCMNLPDDSFAPQSTAALSESVDGSHSRLGAAFCMVEGHALCLLLALRFPVPQITSW